MAFGKESGRTTSTVRPLESSKNDSLEFVVEQGGNGSVPTYQRATGAPVEAQSPLGYHVQTYTIIFLNIGQMIGTGVFSTPASILTNTGSVGLALIYWTIGFIVSAAGLAVYLELASYFPGRSGSEVVYLEQAYPRPKYLMPIAFAIQTVVLSFSASNAIVAAQYLFQTAQHSATAWEQKGVAIAAYTVAVIFCLASNRLSLWTSNVIGIVKVVTLIFISITGFVVLGGHSSVADPTANFHNAFSGTAPSGNGLANAMVKITFSYYGFQNAFNVVAEVKDPIKSIKRSAPASLLIVAVLYIFCNIAYFAAVPAATLKGGSQVAASLFFTAVFGSKASRALNILIVLSAFGNLISVLIGQSRLIREVGRQGVLPWPNIWSSVKPFGTPTAPLLLKWAVTILIILACPAGDAFNFVVDLQNYPDSLFLFLMTIGIYFIRHQRKKAGIGAGEFRAWNAAIILVLAVKLFLLIMPWVPPAGGQYAGDVSFWYATYCAVGLGIITLCGLYWLVWMRLWPKSQGFEKRQETVYGQDGAINHRFVNVPKNEVVAWDEKHDAAGRALDSYDR